MFPPTWRNALIKVVPSGRTRLLKQQKRIFRHPAKTSCIVPPQLASLSPNYHRRWISSTLVSLREGTSNGRGGRKNPAIAINQRIVELGKKGQWSNVLDLIKKEEKNFDYVNFATAMNQLGRMRDFDKSDPRFLAFLSSLSGRIQARGLQWMDTQGVANVVHAFGKMKLSCASANDIMAWLSQYETAKEFIKRADAQNIANTAWAFASLGINAPKLFVVIDAHSDWLVRKGKPQEVANTAWAFATLGMEAPKLFAEIEAHSDWLVKNGTTQAVANTAWAFASLGINAPKLFVVIDAHSDWLVRKGKPQEVANTAWAFATLGIEAPKLFAEIAAHSDWLVNNGTTQAVANTAWAFATLGIEAPKLFAEIDAHSNWLVKNGDPQAVANTAWAFATLGIEAPKLFAEIAAHSDWLVNNGTTQAVANTAWAFATLGIEAPKLFAAVEACSDWLVKNGNSQDIASTAWAFATLGIEVSKFFAELNSNSENVILKDWSPQGVANLCYAISAAGQSKSSKALLSMLWDRAMQLSLAKAKFSDEQLYQLAYTKMFATISGLEFAKYPESMAEEIESLLLMSRVGKEDSISRSAEEVSKLLTEIGFDHELKVAPASSILGDMLAIDCACKKQMLAIEYDGKHCFLKSIGSGELTSTRNGKTKAKRRLLEQLGWTVINIDYRDYMEACSKSSQKQWLQKQLEEASVSLP